MNIFYDKNISANLLQAAPIGALMSPLQQKPCCEDADDLWQR